jgi:hypothetical protein
LDLRGLADDFHFPDVRRSGYGLSALTNHAENNRLFFALLLQHDLRLFLNVPLVPLGARYGLAGAAGRKEDRDPNGDY